MSASKPFDPMSIKPILLDAALLGDGKEAANRLRTSKEDPFRWAEVLNSPFRLKTSRLDFADKETEINLSGCTRLIEFAVLSNVHEKKRTPANKKKMYWTVPYKRTEESRIPLLKLLVERGANPHPGIVVAKEAGYKKIEAFLEESLIHPDYGWDMLEAMRRLYEGKKSNAAIKENIAAASGMKSPNEHRKTRKRSGSKSGSNSNSSKSKSKRPRGGAGGED